MRVVLHSCCSLAALIAMTKKTATPEPAHVTVTSVATTLKILVAEDEPSIGLMYKLALESGKHDVVIAKDGEECIQLYSSAMKATKSPGIKGGSPPFDVVILDYRMPKKDGLQAAKELFELNPDQRIIFASAYVADTLRDAVTTLHKVVELIQKPFDLDVLVDMVEDKQIYEGLRELNVNIGKIKDYNPSHQQVSDLLNGLRALQKGKGF